MEQVDVVTGKDMKVFSMENIQNQMAQNGAVTFLILRMWSLKHLHRCGLAVIPLSQAMITKKKMEEIQRPGSCMDVRRIAPQMRIIPGQRLLL